MPLKVGDKLSDLSFGFDKGSGPRKRLPLFSSLDLHPMQIRTREP